MSNKGDNEQLIERVRSTYPNLKKEISVTTTTAQSVSTNKPAQQSTASAGERKVEVTQTQLKQIPDRRKSNIPPYTNVNNAGSAAKANRPNIKNVLGETSPNTTCTKMVLPMSNFETAAALSNNNISVSVLPCGKPEKPKQLSKRSSEKVVASFSSSNNDHNSNTSDIQDQIRPNPSNTTDEALEKLNQTKAVTVLNVTNTFSSYSQVVSGTPEEKNKSHSFGTAITRGKSSNKEHFKPVKKQITVMPAESNNKSLSPRFICATGIQGAPKPQVNIMNAPEVVSKPQLTITNTSELSKNITTKSPAADMNSAISPKKQVTSMSPSDCTKSTAETLPNTPAKSTPTMRILKTITKSSFSSVTSTSAPQNISNDTTSSNLRSNSSIPSILSSLSETGGSKLSLNDPGMKKVWDKINAGDNVNVTQSVTIFIPTLSAPQSMPSPKTKIGVTTDLQKSDISNSVGTTNNSRKNDNVTETTSDSPSQGADISREMNASTSLTEKYDSSSFMISSDETETNEEINSPKRNLQEEPECLTISSDDETEEEESISLPNKHEISFSVSNKEPPIVEKQEKLLVAADGSVSETAEESALDVISGDGYVNLNCRTVRIGSYKLTPLVPVVLSKFGLRIVIPSSQDIVLKVPTREMRRVLIHFGKSVPVLFYYVTDQMGAKIRSLLNMNGPNDPYFDPSSSTECQRRIVLLPEHITEINRLNINEIFKGTSLMKDLNHEESNQILVRSAPREVQRVVKQVPDPVQTIMVFPPPPAKGGISINTEDYSCLARDVFLNDVIIDFYLKYLYLHHLTAEDREKTHIFSSFFYKRLTDKATPMPRHLKLAGNVTAADIRHSRVKNWTKNIDIFSKDYIVIPLNENQHWFLAIICFPGLKGPVRFSDNKPINKESKEIVTSSDDTLTKADSEKPSGSIGSLTITPLKPITKENIKVFIDDDNDTEDRDEAEATDEDVNVSEDDSDEEFLPYTTEDLPKLSTKAPREPIKQPCILIFDSLAGASRARIIATLRDYLRVEYKTKHGEDRDFTKNVVKGAVPRVPQQDNFTDCGLFVLQYVESFFDNKITDYHIPIKTLRNWFPPEDVGCKRYDIQQLLHKLMKVQDINIENLKLPNLHLSSSDDEDDEYYGSDPYDPGEYSDDFDDYDSVDLNHRRIRYHEYEGDGELFDEDDEEVVMMGGSRFEAYDETDDEEGHEDMDSDEDNSDEDMYKDMDDIPVTKSAKFPRNRFHRMENNVRYVSEEGEDEDNWGEEEMEPEDEDGEKQQLSVDVQEKINRINQNREAVSIKVTSSNNRTQSPASSSTNTSITPNANSKQMDLAKFKALRSHRPTEKSNDECSSPKKFKHT